MKEEAGGDEACAPVVLDGGEEVRLGIVEDESGDFGVGAGEGGGEGGTDAGAIRDDSVGRDGAGGGEVQPGGFGILRHVEIIGMGEGAEAVAAVVEGEDVEAEVVKAVQGGFGVGERAVAAGEIEDGIACVTGGGIAGDPEAGELGDGGLVGAEADKVLVGLGLFGIVRRVEDELPLALVEKQAEGKIAADDCCEDDTADGLEEPDWAYDFGTGGLLPGFRLSGHLD